MKDDESVYIDPSLDIRAPFTISSRWRGGRSREIRSEIAGETRGACRFMRWNVTRTPQRCDGALENCCPVSAGISSSRILVILDTDVSETSQTSNEKRRGRFWHEKRSIINRVMMKKMFFFYVPSIEFFLDSSSILIYESNKFFSRSINVGTRMYNLPFCIWNVYSTNFELACKEALWFNGTFKFRWIPNGFTR